MNLENLLKNGRPLIILDTETTGINVDNDRIIELAAIRVESVDGAPTITEAMDLFIDLPPGEILPPKITELTGITDEMLKNEGATGDEAARQFANLARSKTDALFIAHNAQFDACFLRRLLRGYELPPVKWLDTFTVCKDRKPYPHKLSNMISAYGLDGQVENTHRAIDDVYALYAVLQALDAERDDLDHYINVFGINPKYGRTGPEIRGVKYATQLYRDGIAPVGARLPDTVKRGYYG